jgi:hypothetical protein
MARRRPEHFVEPDFLAIPGKPIFLASDAAELANLVSPIPPQKQDLMVRMLNDAFGMTLYVAKIETLKPTPSELRTYFSELAAKADALAKLLSTRHTAPLLIDNAIPNLSVACDEWYGSAAEPSLGVKFLELPRIIDLLATTSARVCAGFSAASPKINYDRAFLQSIFRDLDSIYQHVFGGIPALQDSTRAYVGSGIKWAKRIFQIAAARFEQVYGDGEREAATVLKKAAKMTNRQIARYFDTYGPSRTEKRAVTRAPPAGKDVSEKLASRLMQFIRLSGRSELPLRK